MSADLLILCTGKCRLCLDNDGTENIHDQDGLLKDIKSATGIQIIKNNLLPKSICVECKEKVSAAIALRKKTELNNEHLLKLLPQSSESLAELTQLKDSNSGTAMNCNGDKVDKKNKSVRKKKSLSLSKKEEANSQENSVNEDTQKSPDVVKPRLNVRKDIFDFREDFEENEEQPSKSKRKEPGKSNSFKNRDNLECLECGKTFGTPRQLYLHTRQHDKKHPCPLCGKAFATKQDKEKHERSHTGVKPFKCDVCNKGFTQNVSLKSHREKLHPVVVMFST